MLFQQLKRKDKVRLVQTAAAMGVTLLLALVVVWFYRFGKSEPEEGVQGETTDSTNRDHILNDQESDEMHPEKK
jgi:hypothetical protein